MHMTKGWIHVRISFHFTSAAAVLLALLPEGSQVEGMLPNHHISIGPFVFVGPELPYSAVGVAAAIVELAGQIPGSEVVLHSVEPN